MFHRSPLADLPPIDPWWDLYMPATFGEVDAVLDALEAAELTLPLKARGDIYAVASRAFALLGRPVEAERLGQQAAGLGGDEADALATFVAPDGLVKAERRLAGGGRPGQRADAGCDLAARLLTLGRVPEAQAAATRALAACPAHGEALRWGRFFAEAEDPYAYARAALDPRRGRAAATPVARDAWDLLPVRRSGWVSVERYNRRLLGTPSLATWAPVGTALGRLQDMGVSTCFFALESEYARLGAEHTLIGCEQAADTVRALVAEGRDAQDAAADFWATTAQIDEEALDDAGQLLASLATADARLAPIGLEAVTWLLDRQPARAALWNGYRAWLSHLAGRPEALEIAAAVTLTRPPDALAWRLALEVFRAKGEGELLDRAVRAARCEPRLAEVTRQFGVDQEPGAFRTVVSGRLMPRYARPTRPGERRPRARRGEPADAR